MESLTGPSILDLTLGTWISPVRIPHRSGGNTPSHTIWLSWLWRWKGQEKARYAGDGRIVQAREKTAREQSNLVTRLLQCHSRFSSRLRPTHSQHQQIWRRNRFAEQTGVYKSGHADEGEIWRKRRKEHSDRNTVLVIEIFSDRMSGKFDFWVVVHELLSHFFQKIFRTIHRFHKNLFPNRLLFLLRLL